MYILGISAFYQVSAAALIRDGEILCAAEEERFTRVKHDKSFPENAVRFCLNFNKINLAEISYIVFYDKPFLKFERNLETFIKAAPFGVKAFYFSMTDWLSEGKLILSYTLKKEFSRALNFAPEQIPQLLFSDHHRSHAASAFFASPFTSAAVLCVDGVGEWSTTSCWIGKENSLKLLWKIDFPHSMSLLYSAFTFYLGFRVNDGEHNVMNLASHGEPKYIQLIKENLVSINEDGSFLLNLKYFDFLGGLKMTNKKFNKLFGGPPRIAESPITQNHKDIARSIQDVIEEVMLKLASSIKKETNLNNLCLVGDVAFNCAVNEKITGARLFDNLWVPPAAGDAGGSIGAALSIWHEYLNNPRAEGEKNLMKGAFLGPLYQAEEIRDLLNNLKVEYIELTDEQLHDVVSEHLAKGRTVGWFQGRMEFGPRALGARSILADARITNMKSLLNQSIKHRDFFHFLASAILEKIPIAIHVDNSANAQMDSIKLHEKFYKLLASFNSKTGSSVLINSPLSARGAPIVCTPLDAYRCFMSVDLDFLVLENFLLNKADQISDIQNKDIEQPEHIGPEEWRNFGLRLAFFVVMLFYYIVPDWFYSKQVVWPIGTVLTILGLVVFRPRGFRFLFYLWRSAFRVFLKAQSVFLWGIFYFFIFTPYAVFLSILLKVFKNDKIVGAKKYSQANNQDVFKNIRRQF